MDRQGGVVGLHHCVRHLGGWYHRESVHDSVRVLLTDLADEEGAHARASATTQGVGQLEALKTVTALSLLSHHIQDGVHQLSPLCVVTLGPVVAGTTLSKDKVVWPEDLTKGSRADGVHGARLQVNEDCSGHIFASCGLIVVDIDPLQLEVRVPMVGASGVNAMLIRDHLPELGTDLVAALSSLNVHDFTHLERYLWTWTKPEECGCLVSCVSVPC